jgi:hypothetical protein
MCQVEAGFILTIDLAQGHMGHIQGCILKTPHRADIDNLLDFGLGCVPSVPFASATGSTTAPRLYLWETLCIQPSKGIGLGVSGEVVGDSLWVSSGENQPWPTHLEPTPLVSFRLLAASHSSDSTSMKSPFHVVTDFGLIHELKHRIFYQQKPSGPNHLLLNVLRRLFSTPSRSLDLKSCPVSSKCKF